MIKNRIPDAPPPFTHKVLKSAIPERLFQPSTARSLAHFFLDITLLLVLYVGMYWIQPVYLAPLFWLAIGTMFWALFVVGHDCGHGSFSNKKWLNRLIGYLSHSPILVPFHAWQVSHRLHHATTGSVENDEVFTVSSETEYKEMSAWKRFYRFRLFLLAFPAYLLGARNVHKVDFIKHSHFLPGSDLFKPKDRASVLISTSLCLLFFSAYVAVGYFYGFWTIFTYFIAPYIVFIVWLSTVTYLHHTDPVVPNYRVNAWDSLRGSLSTVDRNYGTFLNFIHHNIETHVVHHLFPSIPHYHLREATTYILPILGEYYLKDPDLAIKGLIRSYKTCIYVPDEGDVVYYQNANVLDELPTQNKPSVEDTIIKESR